MAMARLVYQHQAVISAAVNVIENNNVCSNGAAWRHQSTGETRNGGNVTAAYGARNVCLCGANMWRSISVIPRNQSSGSTSHRHMRGIIKRISVMAAASGIISAVAAA